MRVSEFFRVGLVVTSFAAIGAAVFLVTAFVQGDSPRPAWDAAGIHGVIEWSYKNSSGLTMVVLFVISLICGLTMRWHAIAAALSLSLIYPIDVILSAFFRASDPMIPLVFVACLLFFGTCLAGVLIGRLASRLSRKSG